MRRGRGSMCLRLGVVCSGLGLGFKVQGSECRARGQIAWAVAGLQTSSLRSVEVWNLVVQALLGLHGACGVRVAARFRMLC